MIGRREEQLDKEREEACAARVRYDAAARELASIDADLERRRARLAQLEGCEGRYREALAEKVRELARKADEFKKNFGDIPEPLVVTGNSSQKYLQEQRASAREEALENGWKPRNNEAEGFINIK